MQIHDYLPEIVVSVALDEARRAANAKGMSDYIMGWREGKCRAVATVCKGSKVELEATGAANEINFLRFYNRRHFK